MPKESKYLVRETFIDWLGIFKSSSKKHIDFGTLVLLLKLNEHSIEISEEEDLAIKNILQLSGNELIN